MKCEKCGNRVLNKRALRHEDAYLSCPLCGWIKLKGLTVVMDMRPKDIPNMKTPSNDPKAVAQRAYKEHRKYLMKQVEVVVR